jgi:hypothetical protein
MKIRTFFVIMLIVLLGCGRPSASPSTIMELPVEQRAKMITEWMDQELKLDTVAEEKAQQINLKYARLNQEIYTARTGRRAAIKKIQANVKAKDLELKSVFTPEQYVTYLEKKKELRLYIKKKLKE